jgi:hypothetical protein
VCEAQSPPLPGENLLMMWRDDPVPAEGDEVTTYWGGHELICVVEEAMPARAFDGEKRRLWLRVVG